MAGPAIRYNVEILGRAVTSGLSDPLGAFDNCLLRVRQELKQAVGNELALLAHLGNMDYEETSGRAYIRVRDCMGLEGVRFGGFVGDDECSKTPQ